MTIRMSLIATIAAAVAGAAAAQEGSEPADERAVSFELATGFQYDSNVAVLELDTATNAGDSAALVELGMSYRSPADRPLVFSGGYNISQTSHEDFDAFDLTIQRGSGGIAYDRGRTDFGAGLNHAVADLDGARFLTFTQFSPYVSRLLGKRLFLRFAYVRTDKDFASDPSRDATAHAFSGDAYVFVNGLTSYFVVGYRYDDEDALDAQLDYDGRRLNAQFVRRLPLGSKEVTLRTGMRLETRDYEQTTVLIGAPRRDDRLQVDVTADLPVADRLSVRLGYRYADNRSNLASIDFDERVYSAALRARF